MRETFRWLATYPGRFGGASLQNLRNGFGNFASPQNPFFTGRIAMVMQGPWLFNFIKKYAPDDFEWGVAPFPSADPARHPGVTVADCDVLVIPRGAPHPAEAFRFIQYVNSQPVMEKLCLGQQKFSPLRTVSTGFYDRHPNPDIRVFVDLAASPNARLTPRLITWPECKNALNAAVDDVLLGGGEPERYLPALERRLTRSGAHKAARWERISQARLEAWNRLVKENR
jgi:ABC-type glycerol-3-phosphate transport system substrate-binding protein